MTNKEKAELYHLAIMCPTCKIRAGKKVFTAGCCFGKHTTTCVEEQKKNFDWLMEDYEEKQEEKPQIDWSKVPVDTLIEVSEDGEDWYKRYFAKYENDKIYAWNDGRTGLTVDDEEDVTDWHYARLVEEE